MAAWNVVAFLTSTLKSQPVSADSPLPVTSSGSVGAVTWGATTAVAADGTSKTLIVAGATRKALMISNPIGNAQMSYDLSGGAVTLAGGIPILAGAIHTYTGADTPTGIIKFIGTNTQNLLYTVGT